LGELTSKSLLAALNYITAYLTDASRAPKLSYVTFKANLNHKIITYQSKLMHYEEAVQLNVDGSSNYAIFFGGENHQYIDLYREAANLFLEQFDKYRMSKLTHLPLIKSSYVQGVTAFMEMAMSLVKAELDEQKRSFNWHKLQLENYAHPKHVSMKSEYGLQPLEVNRKSSGTLLLRKHGVNGDENDGVLISETKKEEEEEIFDVHQIRPKLCPFIQFGLDRQWLCDQISDEEFTLYDYKLVM
jgi:hypothetical protein